MSLYCVDLKKMNKDGDVIVNCYYYFYIFNFEWIFSQTHLQLLLPLDTLMFLPLRYLNSSLLHLFDALNSVSVSGCCHGNAIDVLGNLQAE